MTNNVLTEAFKERLKNKAISAYIFISCMDPGTYFKKILEVSIKKNINVQ